MSSREQVLKAFLEQMEDPPLYYLVFMFLLLFSFLAGVMFVLRKLFLDHVKTHAEESDSKIDDFIVSVVENWMKPHIIVLSSMFASFQAFPISEVFGYYLKIALMVALLLRIVGTVERLMNFSIHYLLVGDEEDHEKINIERNSNKVIRITLWSAGFIFILDNAGFNISSVIASLGIGGIAVGLAIQPILADTFASFTLFIDRPFSVGDVVKTGESFGVVERIGFKTTHIRALSGELIVTPNAPLTSSTVFNFTRSEYGIKSFEVGVDVTTSDEVLEQIPEMVTGVISEIDGVEADQVYFKAFGEFALVYEVRYKVLGNDMAAARTVLHQINLGINKKFKEEGVAMPFPTRAIQITGSVAH